MATHSIILARRIPTDRGAWQATVHGVTKSRTWLSDIHISGCKLESTFQLLLPGLTRQENISSWKILSLALYYCNKSDSDRS